MIRPYLLALFVLAVAAPQIANAHLLHKQEATVKIVDNSANFVVSVPVSALDNVDTDRDGVLSPVELDASADTISAQFNARFLVYNKDVPGEQALTLVASPETHNPGTPTDYVVVMHRVFFDEKPSRLELSFDLFGQTPEERVLRLTATDGDNSETVTLTPGQKRHTLFASSQRGFLGTLSANAEQLSIQFRSWSWLGALLAFAIAGFGLRRYRQSIA
ncbi:MAG: hypothetical protein AAF251_14395 [Pseudomonadota bacterium]